MSKATPSERNSHASASSPSPIPAWGPPRTPLPPHRLAKLANALGVSTPLPATSSFGSFLSPSATYPASATSAHPPDHPWRSPTPSAASTHHLGSYASSSQSQSKFLLHVIPPIHLPHDSDTSDSSELTPPPSNASGYHTQFRRGTLVAVQPSLQAQLGAIAKEYALPSTLGLILYLVSAPSQSRQPSPMPFQSTNDAVPDEPGPRLSEDIWKHIWTRVLRAEREEAALHSLHSRSGTPNPFGLGLSVDVNGHRPLVTRLETPQPQSLAYPITPSPSTTTSSMSDLRSHSKSAPPSSSSLTHSEPDTPDTSRSSDHEAQGLDLPGLDSPSIIPILAKVEFDIDRRKAGWYEPWVRSRRMNHAKRAESRCSNRARSNSRAEGGSAVEEKRAPFDLKLVERMQNASSTPDFTALSKQSQEDSTDDESLQVGEYAPLSESPVGLDEEPFEEEATARMPPGSGAQDPLADVFGTDADTWADMRADPQGAHRKVNPNVVDLALDASSLTALPEQEHQSEDGIDDEDEVRDLMDRMSRPSLTVSIPSPPNGKRKSSPATAGPVKKPLPPPLVLAPNSPNYDLVIPAEPSPMPSSGGDSTNLPYVKGGGTPMSAELPQGETLSPDVDEEYLRARSPAEEKRVGGVFDDLDLGLDLGEDEEEVYDENDPNDRRKSQYLMKAKLDEIERTLAQFSPRRLQTSQLEDSASTNHARSQSTASQLTDTSGPHQSLPHASNSPGKSSRENRDTIRYEGPSTSTPDSTNKTWPAVPFSSLSAKGSANSPSPPRPANLSPSPPRLAVNGVSTGAPKAFLSASRSSSSDALSSETEIRKRDLEQSIYPPLLPPSFTRKTDRISPSPIPLSPDPFGRYPSGPDLDPNPPHSYWDPATGQISSDPADSRPSLSSIDEGSLTSATPSSRFSADSLSFSMDDAAAKNAKTTAPLVSVKSFKKLWRRSKSSSVSGQPPTPVAPRSSFQLPGPTIPSTPQDQLGVLVGHKALPPPPVPTAAMARNGNAKTSMEQLHFDQESPYPIRRSTPRPSQSSTSSTRPLSPPVPPTAPPPEKTSVRKSILKSWKSVSGGASQSSTSGATSTSESRRSIDRPISTETVKPRRPSVLDDLTAIPPSPRLPEQYLASNGHARTGSGALFEKRKSAGRSKMGPNMVSSSSSQDMTPPWVHPRRSMGTALPHPGSTSPPRSMLSASSRESQDERGSFDTAQFEMVSPPRTHPHLSYPYLGHDE
ncbi:hypothetical protein BV22DRAFT_1055080 [Leucogyrophana mollusca]|uniref:Uncharacterized protein n=1 Tax=Leucogyrophana mollusca TaxID=85980 RepID=A0ACB8BXU4_9AGAM|nr:hypothetical protein BV22DRAFT_1055080 [Leucogyrophana mollusca]